TAQQVFGTPFGSARRNLSQDAITNLGNLSVFKNIKISERTSFTFHMTMLNAWNHPNFQTIDPFIEDAGLGQLNTLPNGTGGFLSRIGGTGFGDPSVTNTTPFFYSAPATRIIYFGGTLRF